MFCFTRSLAAVVLCAGLLFGAPAKARGELPPLVPRKVLFGNPVKASPDLAPDGKQLAWLAPDKNNVMQVWVQAIGTKEARQVTRDKKRGIYLYTWTSAPDTLIYAQDNDGDENYHIYAVNVKEDKVRDLTPFKGVQATPLAVSKDFPDELLVTMNKRDARYMDVHRINLKTGAVTLDTQNPGDVGAWVTDDKFRVRIAVAATADGGAEIRHRADDKSPWKKLLKWGREDAEGRILGFTKDNKGVWLLSSEGRDTKALVKRDLASGKETVVASDPKEEVTGAIINKKTGEVDAVTFNRAYGRIKYYNPLLEAEHKEMAKAAGAPVGVAGWDRQRKTFLLVRSSDVTTATYYLYDRPSKKATKLFETTPELAKHKLAPMKAVTIKSRDGLELVSYLTLPVGVAAKRLPMVLLVHGGPWVRDSWGYNPEVQWLANRGYAVLQVNFRGSAGFGKKFLHAGDREWAGKMHDDLIDAYTWAVKNGYAHPKKVAIMGGSYGGYAALVGATFTPDTFACAISLVGPSNLVTLLKSIPPYWEIGRQIWTQRVGDGEKDAKFLESRSPLFRAHKIKIPVLIAQGANDPRVKQAESEQIVSAMRKAGKPVEYMLFKDEGHGFARPENQMTYAAAVEAFLAKHLGGRHEPASKKELIVKSK